jgi:hypothetical protein
MFEMMITTLLPSNLVCWNIIDLLGLLLFKQLPISGKSSNHINAIVTSDYLLQHTELHAFSNLDMVNN